MIPIMLRIAEEPTKIRAKGPDQWRIILTNGEIHNLRSLSFRTGKSANALRKLVKRVGWFHPQLLVPGSLNGRIPKEGEEAISTRKRSVNIDGIIAAESTHILGKRRKLSEIKSPGIFEIIKK